MTLLAVMPLRPGLAIDGGGEQIVDDHAVILVYHHVATDTPASTSVSPQTFTAQLEYLNDNGYAVLSLDDVLRRLSTNERFPKNSVAITFDDAYVSVYDTAWPLLKKYNWPFAVFVSTDYVDRGFSAYMNWNQLRALANSGVLIGNHSVTHTSALAQRENQSREQWLELFKQDALRAHERIREEVGVAPSVYAWPYGEFDNDVEQVIADLGWYGVGQQSGAVGYDSSLTALPRFPIAAAYARPDAFAERIDSEPLPVKLRDPPARLRNDDTSPALVMFLDDPRFNIAQLNCFNNLGEKLLMKRLGEHGVEIRASGPIPSGRSKYTCTAPHNEKDGVFGWYSHLWIRGAEGT
jgi:peptidoglycan/xylan/chitin deacetylase (PgdA/CDA1 family)